VEWEYERMNSQHRADDVELRCGGGGGG